MIAQAIAAVGILVVLYLAGAWIQRFKGWPWR